jgi:hypothetical protein
MMMSLSEETGIPVEIISIIIRWFFTGLRRVMLRKMNINIFGLFKIKMKPYYRRRLKTNRHAVKKTVTDSGNIASKP